MALDVRRLRVLRELAARGTIAATAEPLGYTPPAVSQQLAALEREAGVALLERNGRRRRLTPAGEELVVRTEGILRELEAAEAALERTTTHVAGVLRCAAFASAHRILMPPAIARLAERHPDLRVTTRELEPEESLPALKDEPWIAGREGSFCHLVVIHSTRAAGYEPRLTHITNDFAVSYAIVAAGARRRAVPGAGRPPP